MLLPIPSINFFLNLNRIKKLRSINGDSYSTLCTLFKIEGLHDRQSRDAAYESEENRPNADTPTLLHPTFYSQLFRTFTVYLMYAPFDLGI